MLSDGGTIGNPVLAGNSPAFSGGGIGCVGCYAQPYPWNFGNKKNPEFGWQSRFYDHIIRHEKALLRIRQYIQENPENWGNDDVYNV